MMAAKAKVCSGRDACSENKLFQFAIRVSRKIILSLSERLSKVSESMLSAFFLCLDYIRSNTPACVAVNKKIVCFALMVCFSVFLVFGKDFMQICIVRLF